MRVASAFLALGATSGVAASLVTSADTTGACGLCAAHLTAKNTCAADTACVGGTCSTSAGSAKTGVQCSVSAGANKPCADPADVCLDDPGSTTTATTPGTTNVKCLAPNAALGLNKHCYSSHLTCTPTTHACVGASVDTTHANKGTCTAWVDESTITNGCGGWPNWHGSGVDANKSCAANTYCDAQGGGASVCQALLTTDIADNKCITELPQFTGSSGAAFADVDAKITLKKETCGATNKYCVPTIGGGTTRTAAYITKNRGAAASAYAGTCKAESSSTCYFDSQCATGKVCKDHNATTGVGSCGTPDAAKTVKNGTDAVAGAATCKAAVAMFEKLQGHGASHTSETALGSSYKGNCFQIVKVTRSGVDSFEVVHPSVKPAGTAASTTAAPDCGFCSDECVAQALDVKTKCSSIKANTAALPFFDAIDAYVYATAASYSSKAKDPCHNYDKYTYGCAAQTSRAADRQAATTTDALITDTKATAWVAKCAHTYVADAASTQYGSAAMLVIASVLSLLA